MDRQVDRDTIITLLKAASPTAVNCQPWEFIVVGQVEKLTELKEELQFARYNAPVAIVVCGNMDLTLKGADHDL